ncbi:MAG TPA: hypothetical protein VM241_02695 [Candidatus Thermoplasmatota archaeon]|nr:hypothetical protein [Candidatus Thermoplasmatota archaeon]
MPARPAAAPLRVLPALVAAALLLPGCLSETAKPGPTVQAAASEATAPAPKLLNCTVETRFLAPPGFVKGRDRLERAAWSWGVNPVPAAQDLVPTRLPVPLVDPLPGGWSAIALNLEVRTRTGTLAVPPLSQAPIILGEPATYVNFPSPMPPGYQGGERAIDLAFDSRDAKALPGTLVFDSTFLTTGADGIDLALTSDPGAKDAHGHERLSRIDAFYCDGARLSLADFLGYDFESGTYSR